jgi:hypothetical protein
MQKILERVGALYRGKLKGGKMTGSNNEEEKRYKECDKDGKRAELHEHLSGNTKCRNLWAPEICVYARGSKELRAWRPGPGENFSVTSAR